MVNTPKSVAEPGKPGAPVNVTEGETIIADGQIAIEFHWSPPSVSDIPVSRYKVNLFISIYSFIFTYRLHLCFCGVANCLFLTDDSSDGELIVSRAHCFVWSKLVTSMEL